jgi:hypothetical protein
MSIDRKCSHRYFSEMLRGGCFRRIPGIRPKILVRGDGGEWMPVNNAEMLRILRKGEKRIETKPVNK